MKTDGLFEIHEVTIPVRAGVPFRLVIFGDVHRDSPNHADGVWQEFLATCRQYKNAWYLGMGDYLDALSTSERGCLGAISHHMHETFLNNLEALPDEKIKLLAKELAFTKNHLIGLINGNHYYKFQDGSNSDMRLCQALGCKYLGCSAFIRLTLDHFGRRRTVDIWAHHGVSGGRLLGTSINRVDQMKGYGEADIYILGHDHRRAVVPAQAKFELRNGSKAGLKLCRKQQWLVRSGSFLDSYKPGKRDYNVDALRGPSSLGHVELEVTLKKPADGPGEVIIHGWS